jgi:predicted O-linked N-acetylglucosamine transferase (SPINDLY family)
MLDCLNWSGGNTALDALSLGVPVVTGQGRMMRSRQSTGMLRILDIPELIAGSVNERLVATSRILSDPEWRNALSSRILAGHARLFGDLAPIRALEDFLRERTSKTV